MVGTPAKATLYQEQGKLHRQTVHVPDRFTYSQRKTGLVRSTSHETHTVASKVTLACPRDYDFDTNISPPTSRLVV